ncbi:DUF4326 domain-containing protein [Bosea sp. TWI1241]|uniref:DUF4326 domain-containing protein n=1 Tax=Bosea sp. TWI1241 TaxID=3148904 RepID=UPI003208AE82
MSYGRREQRSRKPGAVHSKSAIYVGRGRGAAGRWGNPFRAAGPAAMAFAQLHKAEHYRGLQWAATRLYALWVAGSLATLPAAIAAAASAELKALGDPAPPTVEEIRRAFLGAAGGRDVSCWCAASVDCHGDVILAIAGGWLPQAAIGDTPLFPSGFRVERRKDVTRRAERALLSPVQRMRWPNWNR